MALFYGSLDICCDDCNVIIAGSNLFGHMDSANHRSYSVFSIAMTYYNMREIIVQQLTSEMSTKQNEIGTLLDAQGIPREIMPELIVSAPVEKTAPATFLLTTDFIRGYNRRDERIPAKYLPSLKKMVSYNCKVYNEVYSNREQMDQRPFERQVYILIFFISQMCA